MERQRLSSQKHDRHAMRRCTALVVMCIALIVWIASALPVSSTTRHVALLFDERIDLPGLAALDADLVGTLVSNSSDRIEVNGPTIAFTMRLPSSATTTTARTAAHSSSRRPGHAARAD
jgi:hypothetical protein